LLLRQRQLAQKTRFGGFFIICIYDFFPRKTRALPAFCPQIITPAPQAA
jgi:hypothetical protein